MQTVSVAHVKKNKQNILFYFENPPDPLCFYIIDFLPVKDDAA